MVELIIRFSSKLIFANTCLKTNWFALLWVVPQLGEHFQEQKPAKQILRRKLGHLHC